MWRSYLFAMPLALVLACGGESADASGVEASSANVTQSASRYAFRIDGTLRSPMDVQPVNLEGSFELDAFAVTSNGPAEASLRDLRYTASLNTAGTLASYTLRSLDPARRPSYVPAGYGDRAPGYAERSSRDVRINIESRTVIDAAARESVLADALTTDDGTRTLPGVEAILKIYLICDTAMASCKVGLTSGIDYRHAGGAFVNDLHPAFDLESTSAVILTPLRP